MRIVGGAQRGRPLVAPKGQSTRPTADRTRQALFNVLEHAPWAPPLAGLRVIDPMAGSGALGFEALSRGAAFGLLGDRDPGAIEAIGANARALGLADRCQVRRWDAVRAPPRGADTPAFDLAFLDPPYDRGLAGPVLAALAAGEWLAPGALVVVERGRAEPPPETPDGFAILDRREWGAARVWFLRAPG